MMPIAHARTNSSGGDLGLPTEQSKKNDAPPTAGPSAKSAEEKKADGAKLQQASNTRRAILNRQLTAHLVLLREGSDLRSVSSMNDAGFLSAAPLSSALGVVLSPAAQQSVINSKFFEAGVSMAILDHPGEVGRVLDQYGAELGKLLLTISGQSGQARVYFQGKECTLADVFEQHLFSPLKSSSDQIGRQPADKADAATGDWLQTLLATPLVDGNGQNAQGYDFNQFLSKFRAQSALGTILWQLMNPKEIVAQDYTKHREHNTEAIQQLLTATFGARHGDKEFETKFKEFSEKTRTPLFDEPLTRDRSERMPIVTMDGKDVVVKGVHENAANFGLGFGKVVQNVAAGHTEQQEALTLALGPNNAQINAIPRDGAPIRDLSRPFTMSEKDMETVPASYAGLGMAERMREHALSHGPGINRWQATGLFALQSQQRGQPSAGAQSGGTCDTLLAFSALSGEPSLYGKPDDVMKATYALVAAMNFGAYHTAAEVFPIGEAMAKDYPFVPSNSRRESEGSLYGRLVDGMAVHVSTTAAEQAAGMKNAHKTEQDRIAATDPSLDLSPPSDTIELHLTKEQFDTMPRG